MTRHAVDIEADAAVVHQLVAEARRRATWLPELDSSDAPDRALAEGDRFVGYSSLLGHRFVGLSEVVAAGTDADPHTDAPQTHHLEERVIIGARLRTAWTIAPTGDRSCRVTHDIDVDFPQGPLGRIERWVLTRYLDRLQREGLRRLARRATVEGVR